jgi:cellulose biosynthesis protein BcsQ
MNEKGGSGKTTTTVGLAAVLAERGYRILVVDLDPQATASLWLGRGREPGPYRADRRETRSRAARRSRR